MSPKVGARVNAVLPHSASQIGLLWYLLVALRNNSEFCAAVDQYLDDKQTARQTS